MALTNKLTAIADAIRGKTGKTEEMTLDQMATEIAGIVAGGGSAGIQSASGTYVLTEDAASMSIDINDIGFIPDIAVVQLDETGITYESIPTKMWCLYHVPEILEFIKYGANLAFSRTNDAASWRGRQGTYTKQNAAVSINYIGYTNKEDTTMKINLARGAAGYPIIAGAYKWSVYKIWEDT